MPDSPVPELQPGAQPEEPTGSVSSLRRMRLAVSLFYFGQGIAFASWASRIPDIKTKLGLSDAALGSTLLAIPCGQLLTMPVSGRLVTRWGSRRVISICAPLYVLALGNIGLAQTQWQLALALFLFGVIGNMCNISVNTQAVEAEQRFGRPIMSSFHGAWSIAGFAGALVGGVMMRWGLPPYQHFYIVAVLIWINVALNYRHLVPGTASAKGEKRPFFVKPEGVLVQLGLIGFCSMATEGCMFDWSGVYFRDIVHAPKEYIGLGYAAFMVMMATGRFLGDTLVQRLGRRRTLITSGLVVSAGMALSVALPTLVAATIGFMLVGIGVSSVVPSLYSVAGKATKMPAGMALAAVSSVSYLGFLSGPPLIGYISELSSLRWSYAVIGIGGLLIAFQVARLKIWNQ
ncbi:MFS transporter [Flaviaesturariibacter amylovorans]|uniref:MFS transporter n=1 Tax=Flaviaesturariibacter amylovorans TaxID=1084520 RepID=UPI0031E93603